MERRLGNIFGFTGGNYAGNVYDQNYIAPTLNTMQGGYKQPMIIENIPCATSRVSKGEFVSSQDLKLINVGQEEAGTILSRYWKGIEGDHSNAIIVAMRGRNPENPSDRTPGSPTEQRLEPNSQGICNTITSVQKDNMVLESDTIHYRIRKLTPKECWRLMDFTDEDFDKATEVNSNTQLYKQAGNSIVVNVLVAILGQMLPRKEDVYKTRCE